jgi:L-alanine-DL-glutamate epimerase-like enolase superfamily enzyme
VTGEDPDTARSFFLRHRNALTQSIRSLDDLTRWETDNRTEIDRNPAAWCSIELALLNLLALDEGISIDRLLGESEPSGTFRYTAVVGDETGDTLRDLIDRYVKQGFETFKIKLSGDRVRDLEKIQVMNDYGVDPSKARVDANNLWEDSADALAHICRLGTTFMGIEEPVRAGRFDMLRHIGEETGTPMILDESLLTSDQIPDLSQDPQSWIINIRVSKMGGLRRSLDVVRQATAAGIRIIVGAQVGETSILTRAGLIVAGAAESNLDGQEGAFGTLLLEHDICNPPLMFGASGVMDTTSWKFTDRPGWGLDVERPSRSLELLA